MIITVTHRILPDTFRAWARHQGYPEFAQGLTVQMEEWIRLTIREALADCTRPPDPPPAKFKVKVRRR